jgi:hemerythrin
MPIFSWLDAYSINNIEIDEHHKEFIRIVNELHDISVGRNSSKSFVDTLGELVSYADYHFRAEEQQMKDIDYNGIDNHKTQHQYFRQKISDFIDKDDIDEYKQQHELIVFLGEWLLHHVVEEDKNIAATT